MKNEIITMKFSNGHKIITIKNVKKGFKYIGTYSKPIKSTKEVKND